MAINIKILVGAWRFPQREIAIGCSFMGGLESCWVLPDVECYSSLNGVFFDAAAGAREFLFLTSLVSIIFYFVKHYFIEE
jgi:hypothetical protein